jgi:PAS domain S-box-containing protein
MTRELQLLIVEDSEEDTLLLLRELRNSGFEPAWERIDTPEAMKPALASREWDVVVSDYSMPRFNGLDALRMVRESGRDIPFIIVSGKIGEETAVEAMKGGARDYIIKGKLSRLAPAIERELVETEVRRQRRLAVDALRESKKRYRLLLESVTDYIYTTLLEDGRPLATTHGPGCATVTGYSAEEYNIDPELWLRMVPEEDRAAVLEQANNVIAGKVFSSLEHRIIHKEGRICWIRNTPVPRRNHLGTLIGFDGVVTDITERKQAEDALVKAKLEWEKTFDAIIDPIMILDTDHRIVKANRSMADKLGIAPEESAGLFCYNVFHGLDGPPEYCPHARMLADDNPHSVEIIEPRMSGYFSINVSPLRDPEGRIYGCVHYARDINARKRAEQKSARLNRINTVLSKFNEAIVRIREPERLYIELCKIVVEDGLFRMAWLGVVERETLMVKPVAHYGNEDGYLKNIHISLDPGLPEGRGPTGTALRERRVSVNNDTKNNPLMAPWRDEALRRGFHASATFPIFSANTLFGAFTMYAPETNYFGEEEIHLLSALSDDVSFAIEYMKSEEELKLTDDALKREKEFLSNLLQGSSIATFVIDPQHQVLLWNQACEALTGVKAAEIIGTSLHWRAFYKYERPCLADLVIEGRTGQLEELYTNVSQSPLTPEGLQAEGPFPDLNGQERYILFNAAPIRDSSGKLLGAIESIHDFTEHRALKTQLLHSQKMEAVGQLAGGIAHDFNNILTAIIGFSTLMEMGMKKDDPQRSNLNNVLAAADRAADLTRSLLTFSRKQIMNPQQLNLNEIVRKTDKFLKRIIGEDIELKTTFRQEVLAINADSGQIEQVLMNLVTNARDAMPNGGLLCIETGIFEVDDEYINLHGYGESGLYASVSVSDSGGGMDESILKKVFDPFFTTKEPGKGTGLGLSIVFGIIKQHNGFISVQSEPGNGTTFKILLPLIQTALPEKQAVDETLIEKGVETILVADDDSSLRDLAEKTLSMFGYKVIMAVDGSDALARYSENSERIDLVVLDIIMPEMNGKEALDKMRMIDPAVKAIFISGYTSDIIQKRGLLELGIEFIPKPLNPKQLLIKIRDVLDREV